MAEVIPEFAQKGKQRVTFAQLLSHTGGMPSELPFFPIDKFPSNFRGSTDMGNVSHRVPSIHPMLAAAPMHVTIHNPEFAKWAGSEMGDAAAIDGAKSLAMTALDYFADADLRTRTREIFEALAG